MKWLRVVLACWLMSMLTVSGAAAGFKLVAHPSVQVQSLSRAAVASAFLKKTEKWPDGAPIVPVELSHGSPSWEAFCRDVYDKSPAMIDAYWQKQVFSGRATPPVTRAGDADVIAFVRNTSGAIGFVSVGADTTGLKEIRIE